MEFRDFFSSDPSIYQDLTEDREDWDTGLYPDSLEEIWEKWQSPDQADQMYQMEAQLHQIKDIFLDNLEQVLKRGEQLDTLRKKTENIKVTTGAIKKKAKAQNKRGFCCGGTGTSRGAVIKPGVTTTLKAAKTANDLKNTF